MNRRTFFTSLASLGVAPHPHERLANLVDDASPQYTLDELSPPQYILAKGTRPFSGNKPNRVFGTMGPADRMVWYTKGFKPPPLVEHWLHPGCWCSRCATRP